MPPDCTSPPSSEVVRDKNETDLASDGLKFHFGGKLNFNEVDNTVEYVGGNTFSWGVLQPKEMSLKELYKIIYLFVEGEVVDVLSIHFKKPNVSLDYLHFVENDEDVAALTASWIEEGEVDIFVELTDKCKSMFIQPDLGNVVDDVGAGGIKDNDNHVDDDVGFDGDDENGDNSDEDDHFNVSLGSDSDEDDERIELIQNARSFVETAANIKPVLESIRQKATKQTVGGEFDDNYSIDTNYMDDPNCNWSMDEEAEVVSGEIKRTNTGSSVYIKTFTPPDSSAEHFQCMYICFAAYKEGFKKCCRRVIGLDGCFLKGVLEGQLLVAVGRDGNNQMWPIASALVDKECTETWLWFLEALMKDLETHDGAGYILLSDQQKGLKAAVRDLWPYAEHRFCARHIYANWRKKHPGKELQRIFWKAAKSTTEVELEETLTLLDIKEKSDLKVPLKHWCKAFFSTWSKYDIVDNNLTEAYNAAAVAARGMPVISMFEALRVNSVVRNENKLRKTEKWYHTITPRIRNQLDNYKDKTRNCRVLFGVRGGWEVQEGKDTYIVNVNQQTCTCRVWDLQGVPCKHAIPIIVRKGKDPDQLVSHWFKIDLYKELYSYQINPMESDRFWKPKVLHPLVPPPIRKKMGRLRVKRIPEDGEGTSTKMSKIGRIMRCGFCRQTGHRQNACPEKKKKLKEDAENEAEGGCRKRSCCRLGFAAK